jgi:hypothetical protein
MASDQTVTAKDVLAAVMELRRRGGEVVLRQFEQEEPDLTEFVLEELSAVHQQIAKTGATAKQLRRITRRVEAMVVTAVLALRHTHFRLWDVQAPGPNRLDGTLPVADDRRADLPHDEDRRAGGDVG